MFGKGLAIKDYLIWAGLALAGWLMISRPMSKEEARYSPAARRDLADRRRGVRLVCVLGAVEPLRRRVLKEAAYGAASFCQGMPPVSSV